jgi:hypothetical protein
MPYIKYQDLNIRKTGLDRIKQINAIIEEYQEQGYSLTLRQVYYQLVARGVIENSEKSYKAIGELVNNGRLAGLIDWQAIEDRTRYIRSLSHWYSPREIVETAAKSYHIDLWEKQIFHVEVWAEKDALIGIVEQAAQSFDVACFSCRGYTSQSEMWVAAQRFIEHSQAGKDCIVVYLGDHDPSGLDMTRDIRERLAMFGADVRIDRIALNWDQIQQYNPPPNPAKITDTRADAYIKRYGHESWELDALEPVELDRLIRKQIEIYLDRKLYDKEKKKEERERAEIYKVIDMMS